MKKILLVILSLVFITSLQAFDLGSLANSVTSSDKKENSLISSIMSTLGVSNAQAVGGVTALLSNATTKMSKEDVGTLKKEVPEVSSFLGDKSSTSSLLSSIASNSTVQEQFKALGLDADMVSKYTPIVLDYINSEAGESLMKIVKSAL